MRRPLTSSSPGPPGDRRAGEVVDGRSERPAPERRTDRLNPKVPKGGTGIALDRTRAASDDREGDGDVVALGESQDLLKLDRLLMTRPPGERIVDMDDERRRGVEPSEDRDARRS
jgi:hypothetical protein